MGLGGVAIAVPPYVIHPKTAVLGRAGGVNTNFYLHTFQDSSYNPLVGFVDGCYVYRLQVNLCGFV